MIVFCLSSLLFYDKDIEKLENIYFYIIISEFRGYRQHGKFSWYSCKFIFMLIKIVYVKKKGEKTRNITEDEKLETKKMEKSILLLHRLLAKFGL